MLRYLSLWNSLSGIFTNIEKNDLKYFYGHVGGDDPAESYHVKMTEEMISILADTSEKQNTFIEHFKKMYTLHIKWCEDIVNDR